MSLLGETLKSKYRKIQEKASEEKTTGKDTKPTEKKVVIQGAIVEDETPVIVKSNLPIRDAVLDLKPKPIKSKKARLDATIDPEIKRQFKAKCDREGHTMSKLIEIWIKQYLTMTLLIIIFPFISDAATTEDIINTVLKYSVEKSMYLKIKANSGTGITNFRNDSTAIKLGPKLDLGVTCEFGILDTKEKQEIRTQQRAVQEKVLLHLSKIKLHLDKIDKAKRDKKELSKRLKRTEHRIKIGMESFKNRFIIEENITKIEYLVIHNTSVIRDYQLKIASLGGGEWKSIYKIVQGWNGQI